MNLSQLIRGVTVIIIAVFFTSDAVAQKAVDSPRLESITTNYWADQLKLDPMGATSTGVYTYNDRMEIRIGTGYLQEAKSLASRYLDSVKSLDRSKLSARDQLVLDLLKFGLQRDLDGFALDIVPPSHRQRPVDQFVFSFITAFATNASGAGSMPFKTVKDYDDWNKRLHIFPRWIDTAIMNMNEGIRAGNTNPKAAMLKVPPQLKPLFEPRADSIIFYKPILNFPASFDTTEKVRLAREYLTTINEVIRPAYKKMYDYLVNNYIPEARTSSGLLDNAGGKKEYLYWISYWATEPMDPEKIYDLGEREVARIRKEMDSIKTVTGFTGDLPAFFNYVKTDRKFFPFSTEEEVLDRFRSFKEKMAPSISKMFNLLPKGDFEIRATEKFRQAGANAQYNRGSRDGTRPGVFYEVIPDAKEYNYSSMETLFLHEAIPGHHFQVALQLEMTAPEFMKSSFFGAFSEGWGLYAESLGKEMGMYTDPYQYLGRLNADMERSVRLVVDVGLHYKGWSREKAIQYILDNQPLTKEVAEQRIERYMVLPAQALSYKIGEQKILELRKLAMDKMGNKFSIAAFHDQVLKNGAIPLSMLDANIRQWIKTELKSK